jgi:hypothetical protein
MNVQTFLLSLVPIGPVISEKKIEMWKVYRRRMPSDGNSSHGPLVVLLAIF